jgi:hypothetical protein
MHKTVEHAADADPEPGERYDQHDCSPSWLDRVEMPSAIALGPSRKAAIRQARTPAGIGWGTADRWPARDLEAGTPSLNQAGRGQAIWCERGQDPDGSDRDRGDPAAMRLPVGAGLSAADHVGTEKSRHCSLLLIRGRPAI